jgi:isopentenyl diphosphate isomerase/L-lactate dehydrogenase-like FMN-dependent dehydrogenase
MALKAPWLMRMRQEFPRITFGNYARPGEPADLRALAGRMASLLDPAMSWDDVDILRKQWQGPLILKGVLSPREARRALDHGIDGIIVSNHGGRQLDSAASGLGALPGVVAVVEGRIPVLVDGGIRRGTDILKALALGASACLMARPHLWGLAVAGEAGVRHVIEIYRRELDRAMGLCGASSISAIGKHLLLQQGRKN